ncbi:MAG: hypothetical protein ABSE48_12715 [Verrucomicrobiota bacterium]
MKKHLILALAAAVAVAFSGTSRAQTLIDLTSVGTSGSLSSYYNPGPNDIYMTDGQTFETGSYAHGYQLDAVYALTGGNGGDACWSTPQTWYLRIYSIAGTTNATLLATYAAHNFTFNQDDWLEWTNLGAGLEPNTWYAYTIQNGGDGWELMDGEDAGNLGGGLYTNGSALLIPSGGGELTPANNYPTTAGWEADFDVVLSQITGIIVDPPTIATAGNIYPEPENAFSSNTVVTINSGAILGVGPFTYQWQTDGGSGGSLTNIAGAASTNFVFTASNIGTYQYDLVVNNGSVSVTSSVVSLAVALPTVAAALADEGTNYAAAPYYPTISQLTGGGTGDTLNYYDNNPSHAGQTFTTGTNSEGYILDSVQIQTDPNSNESGIGTAQPYYLYIYSVNTNTSKATLIQAYTNAAFTLNLGDWLEWSGLSVQLAPNSVYAYAFANNESYSYFGLGSSATPDYSGGELCLISPVDGTVIFDPTTNNSGVFYLDFVAVGQPILYPGAPPILATPAGGFVGTNFTLTEEGTGLAPLTYYWFTDGGSGGALTNVSGVNGSNLVLNTAGWSPGIYSYQVIVSNALATATSGVVAVPVTLPLAAQTNADLTDIGLAAPIPGSNDIFQTVEFSGPGGPPGLNYYFDNANPPGQTFVTGTNASGYTLTSVAIELAGDDAYVTPDFPTNGQGYVVNIYQVYPDQSGQYAALYANYDSQTNFIISRGIDAGPENDQDWLKLIGLSLHLQPNTLYAYSFAKAPGAAGYENLASVQGSPYAGGQPGGQAALIPKPGGQIQYSTAAGWNATFDLGLNLAAPSVSLGLEKTAGGQFQLNWTQGTLIEATSLQGPWTTVTTTSPYSVTPSGPQMFYRVKVQ